MTLGGLILDVIEVAVWIVAWEFGGIPLLVGAFIGWQLLRQYVLGPLAWRLLAATGHPPEESIARDVAKIRKRAESL